MKSKMLKELIIILLLIVVIVFAMGILFYDSITEDVDEIIQVQYARSEDVNAVLEEIANKNGENINPNTSDSLLKSYSINAEDLNRYASENYYESGKKDPFAEFSETIDEHTTTTVQTGTATQTQTSNPIKNTNTVSNNSNTVTNSNKNTNTVSKNNTVSNTTVNKTNTVTNSVSNNKTNNVNTISKDKNESSITTGTFFENKNSK